MVDEPADSPHVLEANEALKDLDTWRDMLPIGFQSKIAAVVEPLRAEIERLRGSWRCFNCGEVLTDKARASIHFGEDGQSALCVDWAREDPGGRHHMLAQTLLELEAERAHIVEIQRERDEARAEVATLRAALATDGSSMPAAQAIRASRKD